MRLELRIFSEAGNSVQLTFLLHTDAAGCALSASPSDRLHIGGTWSAKPLALLRLTTTFKDRYLVPVALIPFALNSILSVVPPKSIS
jgi:hypothetical protein